MQTSSFNEKHQRDMDWAIGLNRFALRLIGMWPDDKDINKKSFSTVLLLPIMILILVINLLPMLAAFVVIVNEFSVVIYSLTAPFSTFTSCTKLFFFWRNSKALEPAIQSLSNDWLCIKSDWETKAMKKEAHRAKLFTMINYTILTLSIMGYVILPVLNIPIRPLSSVMDYGDRYLVILSYYPYDYSKTPNYELTEALQTLCGIIIGLSMSIPDNYFGVLIFHLSGQFKILGVKIENLIQNDHYPKVSEISNYKRELSVFVKKHAHLMAMVHLVESCFTFIVFSQILCMAILFFSLGITITNEITTSNDELSALRYFPLFFLLINLNINTFFICFACEILKFHSSGIFKNIYNCKWYTMPPKFAQDLIPMMIASNRSRHLKAGYLIELSYSNYIVIVKTVLGYMSVIIAINRR